MNIEESINLLEWANLNKLYIETYYECDYHNIYKAIETLLTAYEKEKEKNKKIEIIVNKLMPLAECSYWNYENHTCTHTCRDCNGLNEYGNAEKDTKFVDVEDLIKRHLKEE